MWAQNAVQNEGTKFPTHQSTSLKTLSPLTLCGSSVVPATGLELTEATSGSIVWEVSRP